MFNIGDTVTKENYKEAVKWCNANNVIINPVTWVIETLPAPTYEEVRQRREMLYTREKDPITCQIQALKDEEQTEEIIAQIEELKIKRSHVVAKIKEENPYPEDNSSL
jgi:hypothetical protein